MRPESSRAKATPGEPVGKDIRRATRRQFSAQEQIRIELEGLRGRLTIDIPARISIVGRAFHPHEQGLPRRHADLTVQSAHLLGNPC